MSLFKISPKTLVLGGIAIAAAAGALKNRDKVAGLIGARSSAPEPPRPEPVGGTPGATPAAAPSNYDISGPAANTATAVPAPEPAVRDDEGGIDERAEEAAAAAEAAAIGGAAPEYPGLGMDERAGDSTRPLMESGEGESEGAELAESDLRDEAEPFAGEVSDAERRIDEIIQQSANPTVGETMEAMEANTVDAESEDDAPQATTADDAPAPTAEDDEDPSGEGVREVSKSNGSGEASQSAFGFAGGKVGMEPEEGPGSGLPDPAATEAVETAASDEEEGPEIHPDQTSLLEEADDAPEETSQDDDAPKETSQLEDADDAPKETSQDDDADDAPKETPAAEKSSAVWQPPSVSTSETGDDDDEGGSEWQTWSGRAVK